MPDKAFVFLELDRATGKVTIDQELATPLEALAMCDEAYKKLDDALHPEAAD